MYESLINPMEVEDNYFPLFSGRKKVEVHAGEINKRPTVKNLNMLSKLRWADVYKGTRMRDGGCKCAANYENNFSRTRRAYDFDLH